MIVIKGRICKSDRFAYSLHLPLCQIIARRTGFEIACFKLQRGVTGIFFHVQSASYGDTTGRIKHCCISAAMQNALHVDESLGHGEPDLDLSGLGIKGQNFAANQFCKFRVRRGGCVHWQVTHYAVPPTISCASRRAISWARFFSDGSSGCPCWAKKPTVT